MAVLKVGDVVLKGHSKMLVDLTLVVHVYMVQYRHTYKSEEEIFICGLQNHPI